MASGLHDELDASVELGSGFICVVGPPSSGKTIAVLHYLVARERHFNAQLEGPSNKDDSGDGSAGKTFFMEYWSARSMSGDTLARMSHRLQLKPTRRRIAYECSPLDFGCNVTAWLENHAAGSELHLVVDDADMLQEGDAAVNMWLGNCLHAAEVAQSTVCLWLVSQLPLRIPNCFRFHLLSPPSVDEVCAWLQDAYVARGGLSTFQEDEEMLPVVGKITDATVTLSPHETQVCLLDAVRYYATHRPMCTTVVARDVRRLVQRVYQLLPDLVVASRNTHGDEGGQPKLNAVHFAAAWGKAKMTEAAPGCGGGGSDPLLNALKRLGYSAVLLAFAAFYCGAIPKRKQFQAFGADIGTTHRKTEAQGQSHRAAVLTASAHVLTVPRLMLMYKAMLQICVQHADPHEFTTPEMALHFLHGLVAWGVLTPVLSNKRHKYHCWIPVTTALHLGHALSLSLYDLIPS